LRWFDKVIATFAMAPASVLLVDDDRELNEMLIEYLSAEAFAVVAAADGAAALQHIERRKFDLVILDVMLPALDGFDVLRRVRETLSVPVIMLTARGDDGDRILGFDLGADDYLPKPFNPKELLARMRAVLRRSGGEANNFARDIAIGRLRLDCATLDANIDGVALRLTAAEFRLLEMLMRSPRRTLSREFLTERVLGRRLLATDRSIDTHISNLRRKLGMQGNNGTEIRSVRGAGYMLTCNGELRP
jgi:two-component system response regulator CpxR